MMEFRDAVKALRGELGLTQNELAGALHVSGVTVGRWENGRTLPTRSITAVLLDFARSKSASRDCIEMLERSIAAAARQRLAVANDVLYSMEHATLRELLDEACFPLYVSDMETDELLYVNAKAEEMIGHTPEEAPGQKCYECLMHRDTPCEFCHKNELSEEHFTSYKAQRLFDGAIYNVQGKRIKWNGRDAQVRYITKAAELSAVPPAGLSEMLNTTPGGIAVVEVDIKDVAGSMRTTFYNDSFFSYSGYTREEYDALLNGNEMRFVFHEDVPVLIEATAKMCEADAGKPVDVTIRCHTKDGGYRWLLLTGQLVERRGDICVINIVLVDVTKRKNVEDKLRISEEMLRIAAETDKRALITYDVKANSCHVESRNLYSAKYGETLTNVPEPFSTLASYPPIPPPNSARSSSRFGAAKGAYAHPCSCARAIRNTNGSSATPPRCTTRTESPIKRCLCSTTLRSSASRRPCSGSGRTPLRRGRRKPIPCSAVT